MKISAAAVAGLSGLLCAVALGTDTPAEQNALLAHAGFVQNLDAQVPLDSRFRDESGQSVALRRYFGDRPVILSLVYFDCPMLCSETLNGLLRALRSISFSAGKEFRVVTVSFNPNDTPASAAGKKKIALERYGRPETDNGWTFLTGDSQAIQRLTDSVGFHFAYDPQLKQYAHSTGILVLTPQGKVSHYFYGVEYSAKDLRLALVEASQGRIGSPVDMILLYCYHYDPLTGKYGLVVQRAVRLSGAATVMILGGAVGWMLLRENTPRAAG